MSKKMWQDKDNEEFFLNYKKKMASNHEERLSRLHDILWQICETPIERKLLLGFLEDAHKILGQFELVDPDVRNNIKVGKVHLRQRFTIYPDVELVIAPQRKLLMHIGANPREEWRPDFVFTLYRMGGLQGKQIDFRQINHSAPIEVLYPDYDVLEHRSLWLSSKTGLTEANKGISLALRDHYIIGGLSSSEVNPDDMSESLDFTSDRISHLVVECDGHDTHERQPEDIRRDRRRDRILQSIGFTILRYTGSEINNKTGMNQMISEMYTTLNIMAKRLSKIGPIPS